MQIKTYGESSFCKNNTNINKNFYRLFKTRYLNKKEKMAFIMNTIKIVNVDCSK